MKLKKGDNVKVLAGKDRGKTGKIEAVFPDKGKAVVAGINTAIKHQKPKRGVKQVGRINITLPIDLSNLALVCDKCAKPARVGFKLLGDGKKVRICRRCSEVLGQTS
ncbi:MAG TPA: 50S ribosomal protein L24 [Patescibacteria group bacterium]|nr:50S ribosomal protein L24 [Patescibacteria group bacterium]